MVEAPKPNLLGRTILAVFLTICFYGLALTIASGLLFLVYAQFAYIGRVNLRVTFFSIVGAGVILWAIFPRPDNFEAPGPRLTLEQVPELFEEIGTLAHATGQPVPDEVYLVPDVNAFVAERGGFMGIGRRKVMGIGLPLLNLVTVDELRAILAHEFGHFYGGDTSLGPWIYKTRAALIRTVVGLRRASKRLILIQLPFEAYAKTFLRTTNAISRQQEYTADRLAARVAGKQAAVRGLQSASKYGIAFQAFFQREYLPALNAKVIPPLMEGFKLFIRVPSIAKSIQGSFDQQLAEGKAEEYDTHPSLKDRIAALQDMPEDGIPDGRPASVLIAGIPDAEKIVLESMAADKTALQSLMAIGWEEMTERVYLPQWEQTVSTFSAVLADLKPVDVPEVAANNTDFFGHLCAAGDILPPEISADQVSDEDRHRIVGSILGRALAVTSHRAGWTIQSGPGEGAFLVYGGKRLDLFQVYFSLVTKDLSTEDWLQTCADLGITDRKLA